MRSRSPIRQQIFSHPLGFLGRVLRSFHANQGLLLAGAVAYYILLSIVPLLILLLVTLSHVVDEAQALAILERYLALLMPGEARPVLDQVKIFFEHRQAFSWLVGGVLLFFSSLAFSVLESAMVAIFSHRVEPKRPFFISVLLPFAFIMLLTLGFVALTLIFGVLQAMDKLQIPLLGWRLELSGLVGMMVYGIGLVSQTLLVTAIYMLLPVGNLSLRHALIGGVTATLLWEPTRHLAVWYFARLSYVNVIYGSLATTIVALLTLEIAAIILLLGAQVIAEYERIGLEHGRDYPVDGHNHAAPRTPLESP